ncbi:uncharacterized protein TNCV_131841 [Trichonephila clavipes]|nr:uncharacterized protein TNCV_131841 [Trichonephila clavipes]
MGSVIEIRERRQDFMPLNFPVEDIHLIVQLPVLFNACIKLGVIIDVFPYLLPHLQRISAEDVLGYALPHPEIPNTQNKHYCSLENPHLIRPNHHQVRWLVNVWCGIWKRTLIGPIYFDGSLASESYTEILSGPLADFLEHEVSLRDLSRMWYQHEGASAHKSAQPYTFLAQTIDTRIIGYGGQEVAEATGGVSDTGLVLRFCGRQSF